MPRHDLERAQHPGLAVARHHAHVLVFALVTDAERDARLVAFRGDVIGHGLLRRHVEVVLEPVAVDQHDLDDLAVVRVQRRVHHAVDRAAHADVGEAAVDDGRAQGERDVGLVVLEVTVGRAVVARVVVVVLGRVVMLFGLVVAAVVVAAGEGERAEPSGSTPGRGR